MRVDGRRPHSGPYSHGGHSSRQRHDNRGTEGGRQILWPLHPLVLQDRVYHCPNPPGSWRAREPIETVYVGYPSRPQTTEWDRECGRAKKEESIQIPASLPQAYLSFFFQILQNPKCPLPTFSKLKLNFQLRWRTPNILKKKVTR